MSEIDTDAKINAHKSKLTPIQCSWIYFFFFKESRLSTLAQGGKQRQQEDAESLNNILGRNPTTVVSHVNTAGMLISKTKDAANYLNIILL